MQSEPQVTAFRKECQTFGAGHGSRNQSSAGPKARPSACRPGADWWACVGLGANPRRNTEQPGRGFLRRLVSRAGLRNAGPGWRADAGPGQGGLPRRQRWQPMRRPRWPATPWPTGVGQVGTSGEGLGDAGKPGGGWRSGELTHGGKIRVQWVLWQSGNKNRCKKVLSRLAFAAGRTPGRNSSGRTRSVLLVGTPLAERWVLRSCHSRPGCARPVSVIVTPGPLALHRRVRQRIAGRRPASPKTRLP